MLEIPFVRHSAALLALTACSALAGAQTVLVVDDQPGPGVQFTSLSQALLAASEGDVVLVKPGDYEAEAAPGGPGGKLFTIAGKSLDVVADGGGPVRLRHGILTISGLSADQSVSLVGLEFTDSGLRTIGNDGLVLVKNCDFPGFKAGSAPPTVSRTINVFDTAAFLLEDSWLEGFTTSTTFGTFPGLGLNSKDSNIYLSDSTIIGGVGVAGGPGSDAVLMDGGSLYASNCLLLGGQAGLWHVFFGSCGDGGDGLVLAGGAIAETLGCTLVGGPKGNSCPPGDGVPGVPVDDFGGTHTILVGPDHGVEVTSPVREGHTAVLIAKGQSSEHVFLLASPVMVVNPLAGIPGALFVDPPSTIVVYLGQIAGPGSESFPLVTGQLSPGIQALPLGLQLAFVGFGGSFGVSGLARLVVLDSMF